MPIIEYALDKEGRYREERIFLAGESIPDSILVPIPRDHPMGMPGYDTTVVAYRVPSVPVVKFAGAFSGGTAPKDQKFKDDGSVIEPGSQRDVKRRKQELEKKREQSRHKHIEQSLADYSI